MLANTYNFSYIMLYMLDKGLKEFYMQQGFIYIGVNKSTIISTVIEKV